MTGRRLGTTIAVLLAIAMTAGCPSNSGNSDNPPDQNTPDNNAPDTAAASVSVVSWSPGPVNRDATLLFGVVFDRPMGGFDDPATDVQLQHSGTSGGQVTILPIDTRTFNIVVAGVAGDGQFQVLVPEGAALDANGVPNAAGLSSAMLVDNTPPQVVGIATQMADGRYPGGTSMDLEVIFSEPVSLAGGNLSVALNTGRTVEFAPFVLLSTVSSPYLVQAGDNADPLESVGITLPAGATITDATGNVGQVAMPAATLAASHQIAVDTASPIVSAHKMAVNSLTRLTGTVNDPAAAVNVSVAGVLYPATNNGDGTWSLAGAVPAPLADGKYDVSVSATDTVGNVGTNVVAGALTLDATAPLVIITRQKTYDVTPTLTGGVDDPTAVVKVTVAGNLYTAQNNGNGTWTLDGKEISLPLAEGTYDVAVEATDKVGNVGRDTTTNELEIQL